MPLWQGVSLIKRAPRPEKTHQKGRQHERREMLELCKTRPLQPWAGQREVVLAVSKFSCWLLGREACGEQQGVAWNECRKAGQCFPYSYVHLALFYTSVPPSNGLNSIPQHGLSEESPAVQQQYASLQHERAALCVRAVHQVTLFRDGSLPNTCCQADKVPMQIFHHAVKMASAVRNKHGNHSCVHFAPWWDHTISLRYSRALGKGKLCKVTLKLQ